MVSHSGFYFKPVFSGTNSVCITQWPCSGWTEVLLKYHTVPWVPSRFGMCWIFCGFYLLPGSLECLMDMYAAGAALDCVDTLCFLCCSRMQSQPETHFPNHGRTLKWKVIGPLCSSAVECVTSTANATGCGCHLPLHINWVLFDHSIAATGPQNLPHCHRTSVLTKWGGGWEHLEATLRSAGFQV
jgi:hypothetical protein